MLGVDLPVVSCAAVLVIGVMGSGLAGAGDIGEDEAWVVEAERAGAGQRRPGGVGWTVESVSGAAGGRVLHGSAADALAESRPISVVLPHAGAWHFWVRYRRQTACGSFCLLLRDEDGEVFGFGMVDWQPRLPTTRPYLPPAAPDAAGKPWAWAEVPVVAERPLRGSLSFAGLMHGDGHAPRLVDVLVIDGKGSWRPEQGWEDLSPQPPDMPLSAASHPWRFRAAAGAPVRAGDYLGVDDREKRFHLGLINNASLYLDYTRIVRLGFNADHGAWGGSVVHEVGTMASIEAFESGDEQLAREHPAPEGRFVNADGKVGRMWSLSFPPLRQAVERQLIHNLEHWSGRPDIESWRICAETGGRLDYSDCSVRAFRTWLERRYGSLEALNRTWGKRFAAFDAVTPPSSPEENLAGWFDFRDFCGEVFVDSVAAQVPIVAAHDPRHRPMIGQSSNLDLLTAYFTAMRPMDWELLIDKAFAGQPAIGWDTYCADDYLGCESDLLLSLVGERRLINQEWNVHATDWRIAARSFWTMVGKGVKGIYCFQFQEGLHHDSYPKWALLHHDLTPKNKLGAFSDCAQEIHRLEPILVSARRVDPVKPVALYYSRIDESVDTPLASAWGEGIGAPHHVYEILRGCGYAVRWVTPRQIMRGELDRIGAVVLAHATYVPAAAARKLADWVRAGGVVIGDGWPGARDEHGREQSVLAPIFGITGIPATSNRKKDTLALQESSQGYGEVTIAALQPDELHKTVGEIWQQWDATHPVARALGPFMLSGFGLQKVRCTAGEVIGMTFGGKPGVVVNDVGRGHALYVAMFLGSLYESAATRNEWDSMHAGLSPYRLFTAFLTHAGVSPLFRSNLAARLATKLRLEAPLMDERGNAVIGLTSLADGPLPAFAAAIRWPPEQAAPRWVFVLPGAGRRARQASFSLTAGELRLTVPSFDTHATILALRSAAPLVSLDFTGAERSAAGLLRLVPDRKVELAVTVHNVSEHDVAAGKVELRLPRGWFARKFTRRVGGIRAGGRQTVRFAVRTPAVCAARRLRPIWVRYHGPGTTSPPATEMVWWEPSAAAESSP